MRRGIRRTLQVVAAVAAVGILVAAAILFWLVASAPAVAAPPATPALLARGAYIATASDCIACHTVEGGTPYAGGRAFKLPFGTIYAPNITPDRETGIGSWTDGEFLRAMHKGIGNQGEQLYPAFPYTAYSRMSDADVLALKAYLFSLKPVRARVPANNLVFPFNQRRLMRFWNILFLPKHGFEVQAHQSAEWNRGNYLVNGLGHCGECHTPRNLFYGLKSGNAFAGETMAGWAAWNITPSRDQGIGTWSVDDIVAYLKTGYAAGHGTASGPMKEVVEYSTSKMSIPDLRAIAVYLKSVPVRDKGPSLADQRQALRGSTFAAPASIAGDPKGRKIFEGACASCHAWNGQGQENRAAALVGRRSVIDPNATNVVQTVIHGGSVRTQSGRAFMPSFGSAYSNAEIAAVSNYVVAHFGGQDGRSTAKKVREARQQQ